MIERNHKPGLFGTIFNVMRFCLNDGPGIRTTVFFKGCPLACSWCHNPESQKAKPEPMFASEKCIGCQDCVHNCGHHALRWQDGKPLRDAKRCMLCGECCERCPSDARRLVGQDISVSELLKQILRDRLIHNESGGGVTFSGGEPLSQPEFLSAALQACRSEGVHAAVDTCGSAPREVIVRIAQLADLFLFDLKLMDPVRHRQATGVGNQQILENLNLVAGSGKPLIVRIPVVPGLNDDQKNISETIKFLTSVGVAKVDLLPYHGTGRQKYARLNSKPAQEFVPPTEDHMREMRRRFEDSGFETRIGG